MVFMEHTMRLLWVLAGFLTAISIVQATPTQNPGMRMLGVENYKGAETYFQCELKKFPHDAQAAAGLAKVNIAQGNYKAGVDWARKAAALQPNHATYELLVADAYRYYVSDVSFFSKFGIADKILAAYRRAVALDQKNVDAHYSLAEYYIQAPGIVGGSNKKAKEQIALLDKLDPVEADLAMASLSFKHDHKHAGENYLRAASKLDKTGDSDYHLGRYLLGAKHFKQAIKVFEDGVRKDPNNSKNYYQIGLASVLGKINILNGIHNFQKYLTMPHSWRPGTPLYAWAHYRLGILFGLSGNKAEAEQQYETALKLDSGFKRARQALEKLKK